MTFDDEELRGLFQASGPSASELAGDVRQVRVRARQRALRRRAAFGAVAASVIGLGGFLLLGPPGGDDVVINDHVDEPSTTTTEPEPTTTSSPSSTTTSSTSTTSPTTTTSSTTTTTAPPPGLSMREVDLDSATFANACPSYDDQGRSVTLSGGSASLSGGTGVTLAVSLDAVSYADADSDGDEDAVLLLRCDFMGASSDQSGVLRAYRATDGGGIEQIGSSRELAHPRSPYGSASASGLSITVVVEIFGPEDGLCCPSSAARETWTFGGGAFARTGNTPTSTPNTP
jgi:hypothetical protein